MKTKKVVKYRLKQGVKDSLLISICLIACVLLVIGIGKGNQDAIDTCVANGNTYNYCVNGLLG